MKEPTVIVGAVSEILRQIVPTLIIFGVINWTGEQVAQVTMLLGLVVALVNILVTRSQVTSNALTDDLIKAAVKMPSNSTVADVKAYVEDKSS